MLGDWAYIRNRLTLTVFAEPGQPLLRRSGYTLSILRKEKDGRWLLVRDANLLAKTQIEISIGLSLLVAHLASISVIDGGAHGLRNGEAPRRHCALLCSW